MSFEEIDKLEKLDENIKKQDIAESIQVSENHYLTKINLPNHIEEVDFFNHSCTPNLGIQGQIILVAMRDINLGEELTFDYATIEIQDKDNVKPFKCNCGSKNCRNIITRDDWKRKDLQKRYKGYFNWFIEEKLKN